MIEFFIDELEQIYRQQGAELYEMLGGGGVSQLEHALQCAALAERAGASDALVAAALLHDLGHLLRAEHTGELDADLDDVHQFIALPFLRRWFGPEVLEPIRLHVDAKRFLCATEPEHLALLSPGSRRALELQGGPFDARHAREFLHRPHARDAVMLRRWDDRAKVPGLYAPGFSHFRPLLHDLARTTLRTRGWSAPALAGAEALASTAAPEPAPRRTRTRAPRRPAGAT